MCGEQERWEAARLGQLVSRYGELINVRHLVSTPSPGALVDEGHVLAALGGENGAQYLVRPDGYVAFRCSGYDLDGLDAYLRRWFLPRTP